MAEIGTDIHKAAQLLSAGELVAIPTETVYGLAANALDPEAVTKIFLAKGRPANNPLIIHIGEMAQLDEVATDIPPLARRLAEAFWPGPLTLVLPQQTTIPENVSAGLPTVGVRLPDHALTRALLKSLPFPLAAPSANPFGYISPTTAAHVERQLGSRIPYILDGGPSKAGIESTIIGFEDGMAVVYRLGAIAPERLLAVAGEMRQYVESAHQPLAPGMLPYHYSPTTPLRICDNLKEALESLNTSETGVLSLSSHFPHLPEANQRILSPTANLEEAAQNLYRHLHYLDALGIKEILTEWMPRTGLGPAINDRLRRAAAPKPIP